MADVKVLLADPDFQKLDTATQKSTLGRVDPSFASLSDADYGVFRQRMSTPSVPGMEKLGGAPPGIPKPNLPAEMDPNYATPSSYQNPRTGRIGTNRAPGNADPLSNAIDLPITGVPKMAEGVEQMSNPHPKPGKTPGTMNPPTPTQQIAGGASKVIRGAMQTATPLLPGAIMAAPGAAISGMVYGTVAGKAAHGGLKAMGAPDEVADLGEDLAGIAVGTAAARGNPAARAARATREAFKADPTVAIVKALAPTPSDSGFTDRLPETLAHINSYSDAPITSNEALIPATRAAIKAHQDALEAWMAPAREMNMQIAGDPIVAATGKSIPSSMALEDPGGARAILQQTLAAYGGRRFTVDQLRTLLKEKNADLKGFYDRAQGKQNAAVTSGSPEAVVKAQRDAIAEMLYNALDADGQGAGPRQIQQQTGDMIDMLEAAERRRNKIIGEKPISRAGAIGKTVAAVADLPGKALHGDVEGGIANVRHATQGQSDPLIAQAFQAAGQAQPLPMPKQQRMAGLLGPASIITPPPPDTSFVRGPQGMAHPPNPARAITQGDIQLGPEAQPEPISKPGHYPNAPDPRRALPPASTLIAPKYAPPDAPKNVGATPKTTLPPAMDGSYVRSVPATVAKSLSDAILDQQEQQ